MLNKLFRVSAIPALIAILLILSAFGGGFGLFRSSAIAAPNPPNLNADFLDSLDSLQFLRSDTDDSYTLGTLTFNLGTTLAVAGDFTVSDTNIAFTGGDTIFDLATVVTSTLTILNSNGSNIANLLVEGDVSGNTLTSLVATGTAPLSIVSATRVANLNADLLDDQTGSYYLDLDNETGTCANCLTGIEIDESTLSGVDAATLGGQAGSYYLSRANHAGTQTAATISDFDEASQDSVGGIITDTSTVDFTYNDAGNQVTADVIAGGIDHGSLAGLGDDDHPQYLLADGTRALTGNWDAGSFEIRAQTFQSDVATGTAPLMIASTTLVANLNADLLDGQTGSYYLDLDNETGTCADCLTGNEINESSLAGVDAVMLNGQSGGYYLDLDNETGTCTNCLTGAEIDESTLVGINADLLDGLDPSAFGLVSGNLSQFAATSSAQLTGLISDETGSGNLLFGNQEVSTTSSPTFDKIKTANPWVALLYRSTVQEISNVTWTAIQWDAEQYDFQGMHSDSVNNTRITIPSGGGGLYMIVLNVGWSGNTSGYRYFGVHVSGENIAMEQDAAVPNTYLRTLATVHYLSAGDYVEAWVYQSSGSALNIRGGTNPDHYDSRMSIVRLN